MCVPSGALPFLTSNPLNAGVGNFRTPAPPPPPPSRVDPEVQAARERERRRALLLAGRSGTILTGAGGPGEANTGRKTLLGQ